MWHSAEMVQIFVKIADDYGYDVFQNRKKCVGLCGDLLSRYTEEKNIMQMLFYAGFGEALGSVPFKSEQELKMGIVRIEKFLEQQAINETTKDHVIDFVSHAFVNDGVSAAVDSPFKPRITRTFAELHFKMTIPEVIDFVDRMQFRFKYMYKNCGEEVDTVLEKCVFTDKFNVVHSSYMGYVLLPHGKTGRTRISLEHESEKLFMREAKVDFTFLCSNHKRVVVSYETDNEHILHFKQIALYRMTDNEYETTIGIISMLINNTLQEKSDSTESYDNIGQATEKPHYTSSDISEYSDALHKEILFLKLGKGKKYKIVNGVKINKDNGVFTYSFEMETELHLPDDAPVVIDTANGYHAVGTVLLCEDFQIMLLVDRDLNDRVNAAYLMVEPWKLLEALDERMTSLNPNTNHLAIKLMEEGPKLATTQDISGVPKGQDKVVQQLKQDNIVAVWGPPGTGKTYTMAKIATDYIANGKSVLIVSHSNVSVDGVVKKVVDMLDGNMQSYLRNGKIMRFGYVRDDELAKHPYVTSFNYALSRCPDLTRNFEDLSKKREGLRAKKQTQTSEYDNVEKKIKKIREEIRKEERYYVEKAQLIGTTISRATIDPMFEERQYDLVMFDEVSMAYVPQVIVAAALAKEKFMCVGDFKQLPPISQSPIAKKVLQSDVFSYLRIVDGVGNMYWHPWLVMLNEQRRMHPDISEFPNKFIYKNLLRNHPIVMHNSDSIVAEEPLSGDAINLINLAGTYCAASKNSDNSRYNILSAIVSFATAVSAERQGVDSVGIITPYAAQTRLIRAMLRDYYERGTEVISCATVHQFQGSESDVVIFDAVESYPGSKVGFLMGKDLQQVTRLINVAITRAKGKLITVANVRFWENSFKGTNHVFYRLMRHIQAGHQVIEQKEKTLKPYIESVNPEKMINIFTDESVAISAFERDMERAKGRVVISIPDGELRETEKRILDIIDDTDCRGVEVLMKSDHYADLPDAWKAYCWGTENAVFPLIVIDDQTAWYGLPTSKLKFQVNKTTSNVTVLHLIVRIKGDHTIEMLKALTELETVAVGVNKKPLTKRKGAVTSTLGNTSKKSASTGVMGAQGLAAFVEDKQFCPDCKSRMTLVKNQRGTAYIRCLNKTCKHMEYLTPDLMNMYINLKNVVCPKHDGGEIKGILGKYGPCVRCNRGHFLKPEEI
jgi:KaiC/GvpD/RAD55 family RecA-like ATPase